MVEASLNGFLSSNVALTKLAEGETVGLNKLLTPSRGIWKKTEISNTRPYYSRDYFWRGGARENNFYCIFSVNFI